MKSESKISVRLKFNTLRYILMIFWTEMPWSVSSKNDEDRSKDIYFLNFRILMEKKGNSQILTKLTLSNQGAYVWFVEQQCPELVL